MSDSSIVSDGENLPVVEGLSVLDAVDLRPAFASRGVEQVDANGRGRG